MKTPRLNIKLTPNTAETLSRLANQLGTNKTGAIAQGLALLSIAAREDIAGNTLGIVRNGQVLREIVTAWNARI